MSAPPRTASRKCADCRADLGPGEFYLCAGCEITFLEETDGGRQRARKKRRLARRTDGNVEKK
jgi:hypothetical protein